MPVLDLLRAPSGLLSDVGEDGTSFPDPCS